MGLSPYDTANAQMIELAYRKISESTYMGKEIAFHPTSDAVEVTSQSLPENIPIIRTEELYAGIDYQPLNLGSAMGQLRFLSQDDLLQGNYSYRDIAVLADIPNDISVVSGIVTSHFQTPLSHINVLSQNRGTPNMGLRGAYENEQLRSLENKWVNIEVGPFVYAISEVSKAEADLWWEAHRPSQIGVPRIDLTVTELRDIEDILDVETKGLGPSLAEAIPAFGGKASHFAAFPHIPGEKVPYPKAFAVPVYYYRQFLEQNRFDQQIEAMIADADFANSPVTRKSRLEELQEEMKLAPVDPAFEQLLLDKLRSDYPQVRMRFRSSTNAEDLDGFTGAGLYTSKSGDPDNPEYPVLDAVREVWASVWGFRAYEEREYRGIAHDDVGMALLVHRSFPQEESNGVAVTANLFDAVGAEPGFYVNVQVNDISVVIPPDGVTSDQFIYHCDMPGQPIVYIAHSSMVPQGQNVLTRAQVARLGEGLKAIHSFFYELYGGGADFYAMDVEFKFDQLDYDPEVGAESTLVIKQARPYPGWGR